MDMAVDRAGLLTLTGRLLSSGISPPLLFFDHENRSAPPARATPSGMNRQNQLLRRLLNEHARAVRQRHTSDFVGRLRVLLCTFLPDEAGIETTVAEVLGMSRRTLNRWLAAEGTTFQRELDWVRYSMAQYLLREPAIQIAEVAAALAYSSTSAFTHAFIRWSGKAPSQWRRRRRLPRHVM
jgi:AraC-like DNA-binding protein